MNHLAHVDVFFWNKCIRNKKWAIKCIFSRRFFKKKKSDESHSIATSWQR